MNKKVLSQLLAISLILISLLVLAGCQPEQVAPAAAASSDIALSEEADIAAADRKFYTGAYVAAGGLSEEVELVTNIDPADRKFFSSGYVASLVTARNSVTLTNIDPADRKFFNGDYDPLSNVHPADRKFFIRE